MIGEAAVHAAQMGKNEQSCENQVEFLTFLLCFKKRVFKIQEERCGYL